MGTKLRYSIFSFLILTIFCSIPVFSSGTERYTSPLAESYEGPGVLTLELVDAETDMIISPILNGPVESGAILPWEVVHKKLDIFAGVSGEPGKIYVEFELTGPLNRTWSEMVAPHALFGDINGDYNGAILPPGKYNIKATAFHVSMGRLNQLQTHFTVPDVNGILGFEMISSIDRSVSGAGFVTDPLTHDVLLQAGLMPHIENPKTILALVGDGFSGSVKMSIEGPPEWGSKTRIENFSPYSMFGDQVHLPGADPYDFIFRNLPNGDYRITATPYSLPDGQGESGLSVSITISLRHIKSIYFEFLSEPFTEFEELEDGKTYFPTEGPFAGTTFIKANSTMDIGSLVLELTGPINHTQIENIMPFSLFGDIDGTFNGRVFPNGDYSLTATPYSEPGGKGMAGNPCTITFSVDIPDEWITNIVRLIDVGTMNEIADLINDNSPIDIKNTPTNNATILVNYECDFDFGNCPGSVSMSLQGPVMISRIENVAPYTLFGDIDGQLNGGDLPVGAYSISVTPYREANAQGGTFGPTRIIQFQIINSDMPPALKLSVFPNPTNTEVNLETDQAAKFVSGQILDLSGKMVMKIPENWDGKKPLDVSMLKPGVYIVRILSEGKQTSRKLIVN